MPYLCGIGMGIDSRKGTVFKGLHQELINKITVIVIILYYLVRNISKSR